LSTPRPTPPPTLPPFQETIQKTIVLDNNMKYLLFLYTKYPHLFAEGDKQQLLQILNKL